MFKNNATQVKPLTDVELEMMQKIWSLGPCSIAEIKESMPKERKLAYTSISTIVRILEQKKYVKSTKEGRGHIYSPLLKKEDYQARSLSYFVKNTFDGIPGSLVRRLVETQNLKPEDLQELEALIKKRE